VLKEIPFPQAMAKARALSSVSADDCCAAIISTSFCQRIGEVCNALREIKHTITGTLYAILTLGLAEGRSEDSRVKEM
jgi:hypothetical protein